MFSKKKYFLKWSKTDIPEVYTALHYIQGDKYFLLEQGNFATWQGFLTTFHRKSLMKTLNENFEERRNEKR